MVVRGVTALVVGLCATELLAPGEAQPTAADFCHEHAAAYSSDPFETSSMGTGPGKAPLTQPLWMDNAAFCQEGCFAVDGCVMFTYYADTHFCFYLRREGLTRASDARAVSGPSECVSADPDCTGFPTGSFPGRTALASDEAWSTGFQPPSLACWPRNLEQGLAECWQTTVLEDTASGWVGDCTDLHGPISGASTGELCKAECNANLTCKSWHFNEGQRCYFGLGYNCNLHENYTSAPLEAQRIMHGTYRVIKELVGVQVLGLAQVFDNQNYGTDFASGIRACRYVCLSDINCQYWQFSNSSLTEGGCWIETSKHGIESHLYRSEVGYPLTTASVMSNVPEWIGGEFIQHVCPQRPANGTIASPPTATDSWWVSRYWGQSLAVLALGCVVIGFLTAAVVVLVLRVIRSRKKARQTRALPRPAVEAPPTPEVEPLLIPEPVLRFPGEYYQQPAAPFFSNAYSVQMPMYMPVAEAPPGPMVQPMVTAVGFPPAPQSTQYPAGMVFMQRPVP